MVNVFSSTGRFFGTPFEPFEYNHKLRAMNGSVISDQFGRKNLDLHNLINTRGW